MANNLFNLEWLRTDRNNMSEWVRECFGKGCKDF